MFEVKERWCVAIRAMSKTDTVGVSAHTEWKVFIRPYLFISSSHLLCVLIAKRDFQLNLALGKHAILPFQTYSYLACFYATGDSCYWKTFYHASPMFLFVFLSLFLFRKICITSSFSAKFCRCTQHCTGRNEEAHVSIAASKHFSLCGRLTGSLWRELFVRGFGD